jgi:hypothetical protein
MVPDDLLSWRFKRLLISSPVPRLVIRQKLSANRWGTSRRRRAANDPGSRERSKNRCWQLYFLPQSCCRRPKGHPWALLAASAVNPRDNFRKYVIDPRSMNPHCRDPSYPTFDDKAFNALEVYFKAMMPIE